MFFVNKNEAVVFSGFLKYMGLWKNDSGSFCVKNRGGAYDVIRSISGMFCGNKKRVLSILLLLIGVGAILSLLPACAWVLLIGIALVVIAGWIIRSC